ncbi:olfactory receptor 5V1-like [Ambystoma mexicanum]|uniref:olfactory receptor 5V1-like n=1 Tax=Ambystoma mexicanum TaxID=8296 RepID=UPI0037E7B2B8
MEMNEPHQVMENCTSVTEFILLGISDLPELQIPLFVIFLVIYLSTLLGNATIIVLTRVDIYLQTPMYFFLTHLSILDFCNSTVTVPKMLVGLLSERKTISFTGCIAQFSCFIFFACSECLLLSVMAYDRHVAICHPLRYSVIMNGRVCTNLAVFSWGGGFLYSMLHTCATLRLSFCGPVLIRHFFCDVPPLFALSCISPFINVILVFISGSIVGLGSFIITLLSYTRIISSVLRIRSMLGKRKAFSTCASHLTVVTFFYGAIIFIYFRPATSYALVDGRLVSMIYTVITPLLNPLVYTLRNQEIKGACNRLLRYMSH